MREKIKKNKIKIISFIIVIEAILITSLFLPIEYEICSSDRNISYEERGVYYNKDDGEYCYTIAMGTKNTGGYDIKIEDVKIDILGNVEITVKESFPDPFNWVTMAYTYPACGITFSRKPLTITVKNTVGEKYELKKFKDN